MDGRLVDPGNAEISVFDHGLLVGDGVFETIKCIRGGTFALTRHLRRLRVSAEAMGLPEPDLDAIAEGVRACVAAAPPWPLGRVRVTYTSGPGPLGSARGKGPTASVVIAAEQPPLPETSSVTVVPWPRNERGAMAGVKTTSYGENVRALAYAHARGADEALFGNTVGELCEGTGSNVFLVRQGRLLTPPLSSGCLAGVTRGLVLEWCDGEEAALPLEALREAEEVFLTSTTRDVQPVRLIDGVALPAVPGPVTAKAMQIFAERAAADPDPQ
ncbi:4-amino-4-deoxychorismate lyase [Sinosporangium siamense]|uniref:4-amino-4-deoxychorismate lyase n=2 Tax=Sinosporangium siamense TaxID=1367973 RepID=A0A919V4P5_9ACTN|nr:4-amino-4-deoxychorismate lyase [Sinosporangium siamense]